MKRGINMTNFDFHRTIDRHHTASVKWEALKNVYGVDDVLPMWVADMDFEPPYEVKEALLKRVEHGIYGYTFAPQTANEAVQSWVKNRHGWEIDPAWVIYSPGVVPSISTIITTFTNPGDKILLQSPVYTPFFNMTNQNDRVVVNSPLILKEKSYEIDFVDFEEKLKEGVKLFILCNPHNPVGRVWKEEELRKMADLCIKYDCLILSDEIHSDLIFKPNKHIPIASLDNSYNDHVITCIAPSKTFNLAGLQASTMIIANKKIREAVQATQRKQGLSSLNTFGILGLEVAYRHGEQWLEGLLSYLQESMTLLTTFIEKELPNLSVVKAEGTYLVWIDCRKLSLSDEEIQDALLKKGKLALEPGAKYGAGGEGFIRMNIACSQETLKDGLERLKRAFTL